MARELKLENMEHLLVIVPHQDDEILLGGGLIYELLKQNKRVTVTVVTNGDCDCADYTKGRKRLRETLAGLLALGREQSSSVEVWSRQRGYPGHPDYREFYRDIAQELDSQYLGAYFMAKDTK